jgi:hypothetical protein
MYRSIRCMNFEGAVANHRRTLDKYPVVHHDELTRDPWHVLVRLGRIAKSHPALDPSAEGHYVALAESQGLDPVRRGVGDYRQSLRGTL